MSSKGSTTIGFERRFNPALARATVEEFVRESAAVSAPRPPNMERVVDLNRGPFLGKPADVPVLEDPEGAAVLDAREFERFAAGHLPGAINVPVSGNAFATKAGFVIPASPPAVHGATAEEAERAVRGLRSIGFLEIAGLLVDPVASATTTLEEVDVDQLDALLAYGAELVDVREPDEQEETPLPGSVNIPYRLVAAAAASLPADHTIVTICESGARAAVAASVLAAHGLDARPVAHGGFSELRARLQTAPVR